MANGLGWEDWNSGERAQGLTPIHSVIHEAQGALIQAAGKKE